MRGTFGTLIINDLKAHELGLPISAATLTLGSPEVMLTPLDHRYVVTFRAPARKLQACRDKDDPYPGEVLAAPVQYGLTSRFTPLLELATVWDQAARHHSAVDQSNDAYAAGMDRCRKDLLALLAEHGITAEQT